MSEEHRVEYVFTIRIGQDNLEIRMTGQDVEFHPIDVDGVLATIRPRHNRLVADLHQLMKDYVVRSK